MISANPERPDRPANAADASAQLQVYLENLQATAPRQGLGAATGRFVDHLVAIAARYGPHLFFCFDDDRIPATTNELESFFGRAKRRLRHACGTGSTACTVAPNLGATFLLGFAWFESDGDLALDDALDADFPARHRAARARIAAAEAPVTRRRSVVRNFKKHLANLRTSHGLPLERG